MKPKKNRPGDPTQTVVIKSEGKSYAELKNDVKDNNSQEEKGEVLSLKKLSDKEPLQIRVKAPTSPSSHPHIAESPTDAHI